MGFHTFDIERADALEDAGRYRFCSREELLGALDPGREDVVADVGSGTGFYTDEVAPLVKRVYAVDVQPEMHDHYREKGAPENIEFVTAEASSLPLEDDELDAAFSTMTFHEFASEEAFEELARVIRPGGRVVTLDWSKSGSGADGPPTDERFGLGDAVDALEGVGFTTSQGVTREETFVHICTR
ncbi:class I SAM-dependent methyltransferase [Halobellus captivus]|uniref:class I SAM-dependent methyltransferase n=1 Tax=Halobellus captivus TaxID=2592614 RepID=UPI00119E174B|nr:class I SAM-dependent methyltransferase [Halobellus captivus]